MNETEARNLVTDTLKKKYDENKFRHFIRNFLHDAEWLTENHINAPDSFKGKITSYKRLAKFIDADEMQIDVLAVKITDKRTLENARTMQRNFIARYLNGSRGGKLKDAALVAFYSDDTPDWRFSLVRMDYVLDPQQNKIKKELTPARRFSFLVGENEETHTACKQFVPLLQSDSNPLTNLETAFNIESVSREFFEEYRNLYNKLNLALQQHLAEYPITQNEFDAKQVKPEDFAKKLLGQIVFLYFLQKKGWLGVAKGAAWGTGEKDFLKKLHEKQYCIYEDFFNDILEPLFYEALANERPDNDSYYDNFKCRIPFLNGGLFEPIGGYRWKEKNISLNNKIFQDIFKVFDLYNFTVREDEPLEKEVAIDPEMLGKVFENLIPDNERKGTGTFYTPREIVHYMCQESLVNYLDATLNLEAKLAIARKDLATFIYESDVVAEKEATAFEKNQQNDNYRGDYQITLPEAICTHARALDDALENIKICDPAIGSGAFPVGMMLEIVRLRSMLTGYLPNRNSRTPYDFKYHAIQHSLYGVDIESSAVDIAKLRLWLSLVVDENDPENIYPLPNLDYKIMQGNALLSVDIDSLFSEPLLRDFKQLKQRYFHETSAQSKRQLKGKIASILDELTSTDAKSGHKNSDKKFDFQLYFGEVFEENKGFDIIIANPPYLANFSENFSDELKTNYQNEVSKKWIQDYKLITRRSDLMMYFFPKALEIMSSNGVGCLITENSWLDTDYGDKFQTFMLKNSTFKAIVDSNYRYFSGKNAPNINTIISLFSKQKNDNQSYLKFIHTNINITDIRKSLAFLDDIKEGSITAQSYKQNDKTLKDFKWGFLYRTPEWFFECYNHLLLSKSNEDSLIQFAVGLNFISKNIIPKAVCENLGIDNHLCIPVLRKGNAFEIKNIDTVLVKQEAISNSQCQQLKEHGYECYDFTKTRKKPAKFIMPRGIGRHFCALNSIDAYNFSYVEIHPDANLSSAEIMSIWAYCNSSLFWLIRELTGRTNMGGGMLKSEATDLSRFYIPFKKLNIYYNEIQEIFIKCKNRKPYKSIEEIDTDEHKLIDEIMAEAFRYKKICFLYSK